MEINNKKSPLLTALAIVVLLSLVVGATYAYFQVTTVNNFGTKTATAQAGSIGSISLNGSNAVLSINMTSVDLMPGNAGTYYAGSPDKVKDTPTEVTIGTASISPTTDTNYYHCSYTLSVTHTGTEDMYDKFNHKTNDVYDYTNRSTGQIALIVNGTEYDWASTNGMPSTINGSFYIQGNETVNLTAGLKFVSSASVDQTYLTGTDIGITISVVANSFTCNAEEEPINWLYYGWGTESANIDTARGSHKEILRSGTTAKTSGITASDIVQACGLISGSWVCADYFDPSRGDIADDDFLDDGYVNCTVYAGGSAYCGADGAYEYCRVSSGGVADCGG